MKTNLNLQTFFAKRSYYWRKAARTLNDEWFFKGRFTCYRRRVALWCYLLFSLVLSFALPFSFVIAFSLTSFLVLPFPFCLHLCLAHRLVSVLTYCVSPYFSFSLRFSVFSSRTYSLVFCAPSGFRCCVFFCVLSYLAFCFGPIIPFATLQVFLSAFFFLSWISHCHKLGSKFSQIGRKHYYCFSHGYVTWKVGFFTFDVIFLIKQSIETWRTCCALRKPNILSCVTNKEESQRAEMEKLRENIFKVKQYKIECTTK